MNDENNQQPFPPQPQPQQPTQQGPISGQYYPNNSPYPMAPPNEKNAVMALVFGILGLTTCGFLAPVGWIMGAKSRKNIKASGGQLGGDGLALGGLICGIIGSVILALTLIYIVFVLVFVVLAGTSS
jgi:hypothetical protein